MQISSPYLQSGLCVDFHHKNKKLSYIEDVEKKAYCTTHQRIEAISEEEENSVEIDTKRSESLFWKFLQQGIIFEYGFTVSEYKLLHSNEFHVTPTSPCDVTCNPGRANQ